jgi:hypothetical protein
MALTLALLIVAVPYCDTDTGVNACSFSKRLLLAVRRQPRASDPSLRCWPRGNQKFRRLSSLADSPLLKGSQGRLGHCNVQRPLPVHAAHLPCFHWRLYSGPARRRYTFPVKNKPQSIGQINFFTSSCHRNPRARSGLLFPEARVTVLCN